MAAITISIQQNVLAREMGRKRVKILSMRKEKKKKKTIRYWFCIKKNPKVATEKLSKWLSEFDKVHWL